MRAIALLGGPKEEWPHNLDTEIKEASKKGALLWLVIGAAFFY